MKYIIIFMFSCLSLNAQQIVFLSNESVELILTREGNSEGKVFYPKLKKDFVFINSGTYKIKFNKTNKAIVNLIVTRMGITLQPVTIEGVNIQRSIDILEGDKLIVTYANKTL